MEFRRRQVKIDRTPEEKARLKAIRDRFQKEKPSLAQLVASGEFKPPIKQTEYWELMQTAAALKKAREEAGISLRQMAQRMSVDVGALSRLENGANSNPTIETLFRYASALGKTVVVQLVDTPASGEAR
jgi:DNA-binding XRE family transcriptional regulator